MDWNGEVSTGLPQTEVSLECPVCPHKAYGKPGEEICPNDGAELVPVAEG